MKQMSLINLRNVRSADRMAFTLLELLVVIVLIGILLAMFFPSGRRVRLAARRANCMNNLRQLSLAALNYEATHNALPPAIGMPEWHDGPAGENANRLSGLVHLLPYLEQASLYDSISQSSSHNDVDYQEFGAAPWDRDFPAWKIQLPAFSCASANSGPGDFGWTSYAFSIGDQARNIHQIGLTRGPCGTSKGRTLQLIADGTSSTILFAELGASDQQKHLVSQYLANQPDRFLDNPNQFADRYTASERNRYPDSAPLAPLGRGRCWADGAGGVSMVNTILPPNSPNFAVDGEIAADGIYSAGSFHHGGVQVAFADGSVHFIDEDIDAGNESAPTPTAAQMAQPGFASPYGVWGALGTSAGAEVASAERW